MTLYFRQLSVCFCKKGFFLIIIISNYTVGVDYHCRGALPIFSRTPVVFVKSCFPLRSLTKVASFTTFSALPLMFSFTKFCFVCFFFRGRRVRMPHIEFISADDRSSLHVLQPGLRRSPQLWRQPDTQSRRGLLQGHIFLLSVYNLLKIITQHFLYFCVRFVV
jgi:hypothetical protein